MILSIFISALFGVAIGYPLMKLELKSVPREKVRKVIRTVSQYLAMAVCVLPFVKFRIEVAFVIMVFMFIASLGGNFAAIILIAITGYLVDGDSGLLAVFICPGIILIPLAFTHLYFRRAASRQAITLGIAENSNKVLTKKEAGSKETNLLDWIDSKFKLKLIAFYCALLFVSTEYSPVTVNSIQMMYSREKALPRLVSAALDGRQGAQRAVNNYGKDALPLEMELLQKQVQKGLKRSSDTSYSDSPRSTVALLTSMILEMGEAETLRQLGNEQKNALRSAASFGDSPANKIAVEELKKLKALPELVFLLDSRAASEAMDALLQFRPDETIPLFMKWQITSKRTVYGNAYELKTKDNNSFAGALASYGESAIPVLIPYLGDDSDAVRTLTSNTLLLIGDPVLPAMRKAARSGNERVVEQATYILGQLSIERD